MMPISLSNILLRVLSDPNYVAKGSTLTFTELDTDLKILADNIRALQTPSTGSFSEYDNSKTYSNVLPDYVSYNGNIYEYIKALPQSGVTPGTDPLTWTIVSLGQFSHQQNKDQYLDFGGTYQVSAQDIYTKINSAPAEIIYRGEWTGSASPSITYLQGESVLHSSLLWQANANNTAEEPGTGASWDRQITNDDAYGFGYTGSMLAVTQNRFYQVIQDLDNTYELLDGTFPWTGNHDADGFLLNNLGQLNVNTSSNRAAFTATAYNGVGQPAAWMICDDVGRGFVITEQADPVHGYGVEFDIQTSGGVPKNRLSSFSNTNTGAPADFQFNCTTLRLSNNLSASLANYASNALAIAGGLVVGDFYQTSGVVMIVY